MNPLHLGSESGVSAGRGKGGAQHRGGAQNGVVTYLERTTGGKWVNITSFGEPRHDFNQVKFGSSVALEADRAFIGRQTDHYNCSFYGGNCVYGAGSIEEWTLWAREFGSEEELRAAVAQYVANATAAEVTHGPIGAWGVSSVTNFSHLFAGADGCASGLE